MEETRPWRVLDVAAALAAPWTASTIAGICTQPLSFDIQSWVASPLFVLLLAAYGSFTSSGRRAPLAAYFIGIFLTPLLAVAIVLLAAGAQAEPLVWLTLALNIGYHPHLGPDFDGISYLWIWSICFAGLVFAAICLRQGALMWRESRLSREAR